MISSNFGLLALNLYEILRSAKISFRSYVTEYLRIVSLSTLLILIFALYQIQVIAGSKPEDIFESETYQARVIAINQGYSEYLNFFKKKKYLMKENEKINPVDADWWFIQTKISLTYKMNKLINNQAKNGLEILMLLQFL